MREEHGFHFSAKVISEAAGERAAYHEERESYWRKEFADSYKRVEETIGAKIQKAAITNGERFDVVVDYGDPVAYKRLHEAQGKIARHLDLAERLRSDQKLYASQGDRSYELDGEDVHYYGLAASSLED